MKCNATVSIEKASEIGEGREYVVMWAILSLLMYIIGGFGVTTFKQMIFIFVFAGICTVFTVVAAFMVDTKEVTYRVYKIKGHEVSRERIE